MERRPIHREPVTGHSLEGHPIAVYPIDGHPIKYHPIERHPIARRPIQDEPLEGHPIQVDPIPGGCCMRSNRTPEYQATTCRNYGGFESGAVELARLLSGPSCLRRHDVLLWECIPVRL
jgi:hypothetical protein